MSTLAAIPSILILIAAGCGLVLALVGMGNRFLSHRGGAISRAHLCRARPVFTELQRASFILDALIERSDDKTIPLGMPFSLRLVPPDRSDDYLFSQLLATMERGQPLSVEVHDRQAGPAARLCANGWTVILPVEHTSGWPSPAFEPRNTA